MMPIIDKQMKFVELGRLRMGSKGEKGQPQKLSTWRLTSASRQLLDAAAQVYGGSVQDWRGAPNDGYFELTTEAAEIDVTIPPIEHPGALLSQWYELWSAGGCARRCDGVTEGISGGPCLCNPERRDCKTVTRMSVMLPRLPGIGVWRLDTGGENAALELPGTFQFLAEVGGGRFVEATLRIEQRVKKVPGEGTRRFTVPVLNVPGATVGDLMAVSQGTLVLGPAQPAVRRPELPAAPAPSRDALGGTEAKPEWGERPALPTSESASVNSGAEVDNPTSSAGLRAASAAPAVTDAEPPRGDAAGQGGEEPAADRNAVAPPPITAAQKKKLNVLVGTLRDAGHITTEHLWKACGHVPELSGDENGELHWSPLRDQLSKEQATDLIDRLSRLEANVKAPA